jgi:protoheme IX farnesyltransferase
VVFLGLMINVLAAGLLAFTIFFYAVVYTMWLKRWTPQNIVIGGAAGAFPPMVGWAAATGGIGLESCLLFLIIFFWTPPHLGALSLYRCEDYFRANIPMLPGVSGEAEARRQILLYSLVLAPIGLMPWLLGMAGLAYAGAAILGGTIMVALALQLYSTPEKTAEPVAKRLFAVSILYLFVLFAALLVERALGIQGYGLPFGRVFA